MNDYLTLAQVPDYVQRTHGFSRSRQTVYNWAKKGVPVGGEKILLPTINKGGQLYTTAEDVDAFVARLETR